MITFSPAVISDRLQALTRGLDSDPANPGKLVVYSGTRPAAGQAPDPLSNVLATAIFPKPSLSNVTGSALTLQNPATTLVQVTGLATWARLTNGAGQYVADVDVGTDADIGVEVVIRKANGQPADTTQFYAGGEFSITLARLVEA
jgi:hypothetical protein